MTTTWAPPRSSRTVVVFWRTLRRAVTGRCPSAGTGSRSARDAGPSHSGSRGSCDRSSKQSRLRVSWSLTSGVVERGGFAFASLNRLAHVLGGLAREADAIAAGGLGRIQRCVGSGDQLVGGPAMGRGRGNGERGGRPDLRCAVAETRGRHRTT